jgi:hypothetical protein
MSFSPELIWIIRDKEVREMSEGEIPCLHTDEEIVKMLEETEAQIAEEKANGTYLPPMERIEQKKKQLQANNQISKDMN